MEGNVNDGLRWAEFIHSSRPLGEERQEHERHVKYVLEESQTLEKNSFQGDPMYVRGRVVSPPFWEARKRTVGEGMMANELGNPTRLS